MRIALILILALFAGTAFAQAPVIDSMLIDEAKGILSVYGNFGTAQGKVWCDSVELPVLSWSTSLVTATIPDTGKGSAGGVVVGARGYTSRQRNITYMNGDLAYGHIQGSHPYWVDKFMNYLHLLIRVDLHSQIINHKELIYGLEQMNSATYDIEYNKGTYDGHGNGEYWQTRNNQGLRITLPVIPLDTTYVYGYKSRINFNLSSRVAKIFVSDVRGVTKYHIKITDNIYSTIGSEPLVINSAVVSFPLDTNYTLMSNPNYYDSLLKIYTNAQAIQSQFLPPESAYALLKSPFIISPQNNSFDLGTDNILLKWDTLKYMDAYHIQLSKDSLINGQRAGQAQQGFAYIVDTIVSSLDFTLPPLEKNTKYYWRVCGVNTEGESRWSEVWSFTTGTSTDVKQEHAKSVSLACYSNPAMNELTIVTTEPTRLLLYDVTGKIIKSEQTISNETKWDVSLLPNGTYILGTASGEMQVVQIVK